MIKLTLRDLSRLYMFLLLVLLISAIGAIAVGGLVYALVSAASLYFYGVVSSDWPAISAVGVGFLAFLITSVVALALAFTGDEDNDE